MRTAALRPRSGRWRDIMLMPGCCQRRQRREGGVGHRQLRSRTPIPRERLVRLRDDLGLEPQEPRGGLRPPGLGFCDRPLVSVEDGELERHPDAELVGALVPGVARAEMEVWILPGDLSRRPASAAAYRANPARTSSRLSRPARWIVADATSASVGGVARSGQAMPTPSSAETGTPSAVARSTRPR